MQTKELLDFVKNKYGLQFMPMQENNPTVLTLQAPGKSDFFALLSRLPRSEVQLGRSGHIVSLDIRCGDFSSTIKDLPGFSSPFRIKSNNWVGIWLSQVSAEQVKKTLDYAYKLAMNGDGYTDDAQYLIIAGDTEQTETTYEPQAIPAHSEITSHKKEEIPPQIEKMMQAYDYTVLPSLGREKNFYKQAQIMADYEDDYPHSQPFKRYFPSYHDMNLHELRTYFTWRTKLRHGEYEKTSRSYAYVYLYELINLIGVQDKEEGLKKLLEFEKYYIKPLDPEIEDYFLSWLKSYIVFYQLDQKYAQKYFAKEIEQDQLYIDLLNAKDQEKTVNALKILSGYKGKNSLSDEKLDQIIFKVWQELIKVKNDRIDFKKKFIAYPYRVKYHFFSGALFYRGDKKFMSYEITPYRKFIADNNFTVYYEYLLTPSRQRTNLSSVLHEIDRLSRQEYGVGRALKENKLNVELVEIIKNQIHKFHEAEIEASRPKIEINFSNLSQIRSDASQTRDSLLTEEEKQLEQAEISNNLEQLAIDKIKPEEPEVTIQEKEDPQENTADDYGLDTDELIFLRGLLAGEDMQDFLNSKHLMASILADQINEKLIDEIGDSVIEFNDDQPEIIEDYRSDLEEMFINN